MGQESAMLAERQRPARATTDGEHSAPGQMDTGGAGVRAPQPRSQRQRASPIGGALPAVPYDLRRPRASSSALDERALPVRAWRSLLWSLPDARCRLDHAHADQHA